jgi:hypothetical protein
VREDLVGGGVLEVLPRLEPELALRGQTVTTRSQLVLPVDLFAELVAGLANASHATSLGRVVGWVGPCGQRRLSLPHRCGCSGCPMAAMSNAHIRSPSTRPYSR